MTQPFRDKPWHKRFEVMGDIAEGEFAKRNPNAMPFGLNRPPWRVNEMPTDAMKCTPDFLLKDRFVEVMGLGRDQLLKLKRYKAQALFAIWDLVGPTNLWVWDSSRKVCWEAHISAWLDACWTKGRVRHFPEGTEYHELAVADFPEGSLQC